MDQKVLKNRVCPTMCVCTFLCGLLGQNAQKWLMTLNMHSVLVIQKLNDHT